MKYNRYGFHIEKLYLGGVYKVYGKKCKLIQVTRKGFNFLILNENKCILKQHIYDKRFCNKPLRYPVIDILSWLPDWNHPIMLGAEA